MATQPLASRPPAGAAARMWRLARPRLNPFVLLAAIPALAIVLLLGLVVWMSVHVDATSGAATLEHFRSLFGDAVAWRSMLNTLGFAVTTLAVALVFGVGIAWLVERTDLRGKSLIYGGMAIGVLIPGFISAMGWIFMFHPRIGILPKVPIVKHLVFNLISLYGMGVVQGLGLAGVVFVMTVASLRAMDASLEETAFTSGAGFWRVMRKITLPLAWPGMLGAALFVFTIAISAFDVPLVIGFSNRIYTFSTYLFFKLNPQGATGVPNYGVSGAFSVFMIVLALGVSVWYTRVLARARRYEVVTGKSYRRRQTRLGPWSALAWVFVGGWFVLTEILPILTLVWAMLLRFPQPITRRAIDSISFDNFRDMPWDLVWQGLRHTLVLVFGAPTLTLLIALLFSWVVLRTRTRLRFAFDFIAFLPHAVPSVIFALAALVLYLRFFSSSSAVPLYGTVWSLLFIYSLIALAFATRIANSSLIQIHNELEGAAYTSGASTLMVVRRIILPLLRPGLLYAWLWMALLAFRELTVATLLSTSENLTFPVVVWTEFRSGFEGQAAAISLIMIGLLLPLVLIYLKWGGMAEIRGERRRGRPSADELEATTAVGVPVPIVATLEDDDRARVGR